MSKNYIPIEKVLEKNEHIYKLESQGFIINSNNLENYLKQFEGVDSKNPTESFWKDKRVLITGLAGFAGSHLAEYLLNLGAEVYGTVRRHAVPKYENIEHIRDKISFQEMDLTSLERTLSIFKKIQPQHIFHLAAESFVPTSFREPNRVMYNNTACTVNIFEAARVYDSDLESIQVACSSEQYGLVGIDEIPVTEELKKNPFRPRSIYGITKVVTEYTANLYNKAYGLPSFITRGFNHEGPRRGLQFVTSVIHRQIIRVLEGKQNNIVIGNPNAIRDFTHVIDTVRAYILVCEKGRKAEPYNVCSGKGISIADYIEICKTLYDLDVPVLIDSDRIRPSDVPILIGNNEKIKSEIGWAPLYPITKIMKDGISYFQEHKEFLDIESH